MRYSEQPSWAIGIPEAGMLSEVQSEAARAHGEMAVQNGFARDDYQIFLANIVDVGIGEGVLRNKKRVRALLDAMATIRAMGYAACEQDLKEIDCMQENSSVSEVAQVPSWGTAAGYVTGDPNLLHARGHTDDEIAGIQHSISKTNQSGDLTE